jgi:hypothetical protein
MGQPKNDRGRAAGGARGELRGAGVVRCHGLTPADIQLVEVSAK